MRTYTSKSTHQSHTPATRSKATRQAPVDTILQQYKNSIQRYAVEDEEPVQSKLESARQPQQPVQREEKPNNTGLPDQLKAGIENLSGYSMDDVTVHYNSDKPAQLQALAYAQGTDIHIAPGQEQHLPHEAWHVVQQKQGRVQPTMQLQGIQVNDDEKLEKEADGIKWKNLPLKDNKCEKSLSSKVIGLNNIQRKILIDGKEVAQQNNLKGSPETFWNEINRDTNIILEFRDEQSAKDKIEENREKILIQQPAYATGDQFGLADTMKMNSNY
ncbi:MAG: DUF4157 domain-containing protein, partial [Tannerellaceae bacterium]|nr:DUF4157 domain-containing protein [Tannerellaceae bacterium]